MNPSFPANTAAPEPAANRRVVPVWLLFLLFVFLFWGMYYFDQRGGYFSAQVYTPYRSLEDVRMYQPITGGANLERGRAVYDNVCALCHNVDGSGKPNQAPPLAGSSWVTGPVTHLIRIPLAGLTGPIEVKGEQWNLAMPAMGAALSDEDLAAVLTYMRASWGNKASEISTDQVQAVRAALAGRTQPFTAAELATVPEK
ncbi:MAG TPA: cytochrome c [Clostridia bacterium]|nr:cytochrome c [Clostridia bacterium]